ncbi:MULTISPECIES: hypothetical protein [unclassified Moorena]|nr:MULTISPECIES: hypothetical protein [unclassified Moorena]
MNVMIFGIFGILSLKSFKSFGEPSLGRFLAGWRSRESQPG